MRQSPSNVPLGHVANLLVKEDLDHCTVAQVAGFVQSVVSELIGAVHLLDNETWIWSIAPFFDH